MLSYRRALPVVVTWIATLALSACSSSRHDYYEVDAAAVVDGELRIGVSRDHVRVTRVPLTGDTGVEFLDTTWREFSFRIDDIVAPQSTQDVHPAYTGDPVDRHGRLRGAADRHPPAQMCQRYCACASSRRGTFLLTDAGVLNAATKAVVADLTHSTAYDSFLREAYYRHYQGAAGRTCALSADGKFVIAFPDRVFDIKRDTQMVEAIAYEPDQGLLAEDAEIVDGALNVLFNVSDRVQRSGRFVVWNARTGSYADVPTGSAEPFGITTPSVFLWWNPERHLVISRRFFIGGGSRLVPTQPTFPVTVHDYGRGVAFHRWMRAPTWR